MSDTLIIKRKCIECGRAGPHLLITGGVHGDEYEPMEAIRRLIREIDPARLRGELTLVPCLNEPAFENKTRSGPDGLDLARTFPGDPDGSITERIANAAARLIAEADYYIDLHTGGLAMVVSPMSGYTLNRDPRILDTQRRMSKAFNLPIIWGTDPNLDGRSLSAAHDANVPAIYAEWGGGGGCDSRGVRDYADGCLNVMAALDMIDRDRPAPRVRHVVEDARPQSGYMQSNYNAPRDGHFEPAVQLDDAVGVGDTLGAIVDPLGDVLDTVTSTQQGIVLTLRTLPRVETGDCLAVILELDPPNAPESQT